MSDDNPTQVTNCSRETLEARAGGSHPSVFPDLRVLNQRVDAVIPVNKKGQENGGGIRVPAISYGISGEKANQVCTTQNGEARWHFFHQIFIVNE